MLERVAIIGAGAWGTALAQAAARAGRDVTLVARDPAVVTEINSRHTNSAHLGAQRLDETIRGALAPGDAELLVLAVPAQASRAALAGLDPGLRPVVLTAKGLE